MDSPVADKSAAAVSFVAVTRLRLRSIRFLLPFLLRTWMSARQAARTPGFLGGSVFKDGLTFWTATLWHDANAMRAYRAAGAHGHAMPKLKEWCDEAAVAHWIQGGFELPSWDEAHSRMVSEGRSSPVQHPSAAHERLSFGPPSSSNAGLTIRPKTA
jgi:hypothetical protein